MFHFSDALNARSTSRAISVIVNVLNNCCILYNVVEKLWNVIDYYKEFAGVYVAGRRCPDLSTWVHLYKGKN